MIQNNTVTPLPESTEEAFLVHIRTRDILAYIQRVTGQPDPVRHVISLLELNPHAPPDWHQILRSGLRSHLHINLGIPGVESPDHPIEENPAALYAAVVLQIDSLPVILSGELELAINEHLISNNALSKLRKRIREWV